MADSIVYAIVTSPLWGVFGPAVRGFWLLFSGYDPAVYGFAAAAIGLVAAGAVLVWRAILARREHSAIRAQGDRPPRRNAPWGCVLAVGVPLVALGALILGFIVWMSWTSALGLD